jgi:regulator of sigma E protease
VFQILVNTFFLRDINQVRVERYNGKQENISIPEDIGTVMFKNGAINAFTPMVPAVLDSIVPNSPAYNAGLTSGDKILKVNGNEIISNLIPLNEDKKIGVTVLLPKIVPTKLEYTFYESIIEGYDRAYWTFADYIAQFSYVFTSKGIMQLGGFAAIGSLYPPTWNWQGFWETTAFISIILGFMNALPIPALDGGHATFLFYEMLTGRKPNDKVAGYAQMIGFFLLMALVLFANGNDIYRWLF